MLDKASRCESVPIRKVIDRCLSLNPNDSQFNMYEVLLGIEEMKDSGKGFGGKSVVTSQTIYKGRVKDFGEVHPIHPGMTRAKLISWFRSGGKLEEPQKVAN